MSDALRALLPSYGLAANASLRILNQSENTTWIAGAEPTQIILRQHREGYHTRSEIASELDWLAALQATPGLRCPRPLPSREGTLIHRIDNRYTVAFALIAGREPVPGDDLRPWYANLGQTTAQLHDHARCWPRSAGFTRKRWDCDTILGPDPHWGDWRKAPGLTPDASAVLERLSADLCLRLTAYGTGPEVFGLIHADLRLANLLIDGDGLWVIDFDDCGFGWRMYDFAAAVSFIETDARIPELADLWCEGYRQAGTLTKTDEAILPVLVMLRRILLTAWIGTRADSDTAQALGRAEYTAGTADLAERFLVRGPAAFWRV
jgi:Ser/Thr protein kinase RdoA (MazF antagonist)